MGSGLSGLSAEKALPELCTKEQFLKLAGGRYTEESYNYFVDHDDLISRKRLVEISSLTDVYLSHEWGIDERGRSNHDRVMKIDSFLRSKGLFTYIEEGQQSNSGVVKTVDRIRESITKTQVVIVFMTKRYLDKITRGYDHIVKTEFLLGLEIKGSVHMLPVVMEEEANLECPPTTPNILYDEFKHKRSVDMTEFEVVGDQLENLYNCLKTILKPLRDGGPYERTRFIWHTSCEGRHYEWLRNNTNFDHLIAVDYSARFAAAHVQTTSQMFQMLQLNGQFLLDLNIPPEHDIILKKAIKADLDYNTESKNTMRIDKIVAASDQKLKDDSAEEQRKSDYFNYIAAQIKENIKMGIEDEISSAYRAEWNVQQFQLHLEDRKQKMLQDAEQQRAQFASSLRLIHRFVVQQQMRSIENMRLQEYMRIVEITSVDKIIHVLWALLVKGDSYMKRAADRQVDYFAPKNPEHEQIVYFDSSHMTPGGYDRRLNLMHLQVNDHREEDRELAYLLRESCYVFKVLQLMCTNNIVNANRVSLCGGIRMMVSLLSQSFLFECDFNSPFLLQAEFQDLSYPLEGLQAMRYMCNPSRFRSYANAKIIFLFAEAGTVSMLMDIIRFHMEVDAIVKAALVLLALMLSSSNGELTDYNVQQFMADSSHLVLLTLLLERNNKQRTSLAAELSSAILVIFGIILRNGKFNDVLNGNRLHLIASTTMAAIAESGNCDDDTKLRLCHVLENIFYRHWCQWDELASTNTFNRNYPTAQGWKIPPPLNLVVICSLERVRVVNYLREELYRHIDVDVEADNYSSGGGRTEGLQLNEECRGFYLAAIRCICNMCGISKSYKRSCISNGIQERIVAILKAAALVLLPTAASDKNAKTATADEIASTKENTELVDVCICAIGNLMVLHSSHDGGPSSGLSTIGGFVESTFEGADDDTAASFGGGDGRPEGSVYSSSIDRGCLLSPHYNNGSNGVVGVRNRPPRYKKKTHNFTVQSSAAKFAFTSGDGGGGGGGDTISHSNVSVQSDVHFSDSVQEHKQYSSPAATATATEGRKSSASVASNTSGSPFRAAAGSARDSVTQQWYQHPLDAGLSMESVPLSATGQSSVATFSPPDQTRMPPKDKSSIFVDPFTIFVLQKGVAEILLQILHNNHTEYSLVHSCFFLISKMVYKGCTDTCQRLVSLGVCDKVCKTMKYHLKDKDMFIMGCIILSGLSSSNDVLVGADLKLLQLDACALVVQGMCYHCPTRGKSKWSHMSRPYCCRVCTESCFAAYCLTRNDKSNKRYPTAVRVIPGTEQFIAAGFVSQLIRPELLVTADKGLCNLLEETRSLMDFRFNFAGASLPQPHEGSVLALGEGRSGGGETGSVGSQNYISSNSALVRSSANKLFNVDLTEGKQYMSKELSLPTCKIPSNSDCLERFQPPVVGSENQLLGQYITPSGSNAAQQIAVMENVKHLKENNFVNVDKVGNVTSGESDLVMEELFEIFHVKGRG